MEQNKKPIIYQKDFDVLMSFINNPLGSAQFEWSNAEKLKEELLRGNVVDDVPPDVVRLGSKFTIVDKATNKKMTFSLVLPSQASTKEGKISIFAPIGTAMIGYSKGEEVVWTVPSGVKTFVLQDVVN